VSSSGEVNCDQCVSPLGMCKLYVHEEMQVNIESINMDSMNSHSLVNCCLFNARSLVNKVNEFHMLIYSGTCLLYFITETWLTSDISSGMLDPLSKFTVI